MSHYLGEFEQMVLLAILKQGNRTSGTRISRELERSAGRHVSRGALYTTLDRMKKKGLIEWQIEKGDARRSHLPRRLFTVQPMAIEALRASRRALVNLWQGSEEFMSESES